MKPTLYEYRIKGRTEAVEFIHQLTDEWLSMAKAYRTIGADPKIAFAYEECAEMLDRKIEDFANEK